ncbi:ATP-binding protein [Dethiosulfatarculus sandiegensis]|uniref:Mg-protoporphyrin IX chelatase n=1 Tax=Dethiosulfatarculus sandiegensis TaxID=1429043 RepID=A0A0D2J1R3_9BACT|nr:ATP-binding protein [Dethiosulfatarculus sandiegensis]KIX12159.1 magnesium chelatase [Dethiosulfatarculus sandiegensis]
MKNRSVYPFAAIVGQEKMKLALILNVINPTLSGVLIRGEKGTGKSTAARSLAEILPEIPVVTGCPFQLKPQDASSSLCSECGQESCGFKGLEPEETNRKVQVVELPVGATEDRVVGTMDLEQALKQGEKHFEPGILAASHRGILYVDEVNLLDDHVVDVLLDSAAMGVCTIEREGVSFSHPARFTLVGTMNPEEGDLRPQLLDRFGLCVQVTGIEDTNARVEVMERRLAFEQDPAAFTASYTEESQSIVKDILEAKELLPRVQAGREIMVRIAEICLSVGTDGHRGDIITLKTAKTLAAWQKRTRVIEEDVDQAVELVLPHRIRRQPFEDVAVNMNTFKSKKIA